MTTLTDLIERLERAEGPDPQLDVLIAAARDGATAEWQSYKDEFAFHRDGMWVSVNVLPFTGSIDAALTLVPDDHTVYLTRPNQNTGQLGGKLSYACVAPPGMGGPQYAKKRAHLSAYHKQPAVALCIAALKAAQPGEQTIRTRSDGKPDGR